MSFRFRRSVKLTPGIRIYYSKRGGSSSIGEKGASFTIGKWGIYENAGSPSGSLSHRIRLGALVKGKQLSRKIEHSGDATENEMPTVMNWDEEQKDFIFSSEDGRLLSSQEIEQVKKINEESLLQVYQVKVEQINQESERLLHLHHHIFKCEESLPCIAEKSIPMDALESPDLRAIYEEIYRVRESQWSYFDKISYRLPQNKKRLVEEITKDAQFIYEEEKEIYEYELGLMEEEKEHRLELVARVESGDMSAMENWMEIFLYELDFPMRAEVEFQIFSKEVAYVDIELPKVHEFLVRKAVATEHASIEIEETVDRELYPQLVAGTALYLASVFFNYLPTLTQVYLSGYNVVADESTGENKDHYIYSLKIEKDTFYSLDMKNISPIDAFQQFEARLNVDDHIFRDIIPYEPE